LPAPAGPSIAMEKYGNLHFLQYTIYIILI
jgi:hypothetical protein